MEPALLKPILEAALLTAGQPLTIAQLSELFDEDGRPTHTELAQALVALSADCDGRGVELVEVASGFRYQVRASVHAHVARLWTERQSKYSRALLETLALIAYRQPITRGEIEQVRGVAVSSNIIKALEEREWIRSVGHRDVPGRPELLGTTRTFLDYFGLKSLDQLPPLSELKDFGELDPQLSFEDPDAPKPAAIVAGVQDDAEPDDGDGDDAGGDTTDQNDETGEDAGDTVDDDISSRSHPHDDAPAPVDTHTALVEDDDSTGA